MKYIKKIILPVLLGLSLFLAACGQPTKTGGGGKQQPYNPDTGQYK